MKKTICVDFDHTITKTTDEYHFGNEEPNEEVIEWVQQQYYRGNTIIIWTARPWDEAQIIAARLIEWGVRWHGLRCEKGGGDVFIDDKAVNVQGDGWRDEAGELLKQLGGPADAAA